MMKKYHKILGIAFVICLILGINGGVAHAAIAFDNVFNTTQGTTNYSVAFTTSGSNRILIGCLWVTGTNTITSATYNGVSLTQIDTSNFLGSNMYSFYLVNPALGSNTFNIQTTGGSLIVGLASYTGAAQSGQPDNHHINNASAVSTLTDTLTSVADNSWHIGCFYNDTTGNTTAGAGTTRRSVGTVDAGIFDNNADIHPAGSNSIIANLASGSGRLQFLSMTIAPATANPPTIFENFTNFGFF